MIKPMSKTFFLGSYIGAGVANVLIALIMANSSDYDIFPLLILLVLASSIYVTVVASIMWYRAWLAIQDGHARTTPGKAVGFSFIPLFNLYWAFQLVLGFAKDFNAFIKRHKVKTTELSEQYFLIMTILVVSGILLSRIPYLGPLFSLGMLVMMIILSNNIIDGVDSIVKANLRIEGYEVADKPKIIVPFADKVLGIIAISITGFAILREIVISSSFLFRFGFGFVQFLSFVYWGIIIYLGSLCKHKVLRIVAMSLPAIPVLVSLWRLFFMKY
ncbi:MAG: hypothetical protein KKD07_01405 [Candidatus Omnitrophica bacterium]|nr:hypothetical protein [Candidatus Omnitrophota bacterium]